MLKREGQTAEGKGETEPGWGAGRAFASSLPLSRARSRHSMCDVELEKQDSRRLIRQKTRLYILAQLTL